MKSYNGLGVKDYINYRDSANREQRAFITDIGRDRDGDMYLEIQNVSSSLRVIRIDTEDYINKVQDNDELYKGEVEFLVDLALNTNDIKWLQELSILIGKCNKKIK
jgi:hypothetical protein